VRRPIQGFTLIALLLPALGGAKEAAIRAACLSNQRQVGLAVPVYALDHDDVMPLLQVKDQTTHLPEVQTWHLLVAPYLGEEGTNHRRLSAAQRGCGKFEGTPYNFWPSGWPGQEPVENGKNLTKTGYGLNIIPMAPQDTRWMRDTGLCLANESPFRLQDIELAAGRSIIGESYELWIYAYASPLSGENGDGFKYFDDPANNFQHYWFADPQRHGEDAGNYTFFDGHAETLDKERIYWSIRDPPAAPGLLPVN